MPSLLSLMENDVRGMVVNRGGGRVGYAASALLKVLLYPRIQAVLLFRVAHWLYRKRLTLPAYYLQAVILRNSGAELHPAAQIGPGFCLVHSSGVVIGDRAKIGAHFICFHGVTVGDSGKGDGQPVFGRLGDRLGRGENPRRHHGRRPRGCRCELSCVVRHPRLCGRRR